jgi:tetratricopeptide (TPR) repeat protein
VAREVLGIAAYRAGEFREALAALGAYRRMSGRVDQNHLIADAYRATGQPEKAVPLIREELASELPPSLRAEATAVGAAALADMGRYDEALALLAVYPSREDMAAGHDLRVWYVHGDVLERAGRRTDAIRLFELVQRHDPGAFDVEDRLTRLHDPS